MDKIDESAIKKIKLNALNSAKSLLNEQIDVIFYDATTLYFESFEEGSLRQKGLYRIFVTPNQQKTLLSLAPSLIHFFKCMANARLIS